MIQRNDESKAPSGVDILLKEYDHRFQEILHHLERYDKQADYLNLFLTSIIGVGGLLFSDKMRGYLTSSSTIKPQWIYASFLVFGGFLLFYLFSSIVNSLFMLYLNGGRIAAIEIEVNERFGECLLNWDSVAMPHFFRLKSVGKGLWIRPTVLAGLWILLIFLLVCGILGFLCLEFAPELSLLYIPVITFLAVFHIHQWALLNSVGRSTITKFFTSKTEEVSNISLKLEHLACLLPVLSVTVIVLYSLHIGAFSFNSKYDFPVLAIPSIYIGDLLILPILNYEIVRWFKEFYAPRDVFLNVKSGLVACMAFGFDAYTHYLWIHDPWSGFMDLSYGHLTLAGWVHFFFSNFEVWLVLLFLVLWTSSANTKAIQAGKNAGRVFVIFTVLGIADLLIKHFYVLKEGGWNWLLVREAAVSLLPFLTGLCVYRYVIRKTRKEIKITGPID